MWPASPSDYWSETQKVWLSVFSKFENAENFEDLKTCLAQSVRSLTLKSQLLKDTNVAVECSTLILFIISFTLIKTSSSCRTADKKHDASTTMFCLPLGNVAKCSV